MKDESASASDKCFFSFIIFIFGLLLVQGSMPAAHGARPPEENPSLSTASQPSPSQNLAFEPSRPVTGDKLRAVVPVDDQDPRQPKMFYRWRINNQVVQESWESALDSPLKQGDIVELEVTTSNGLPLEKHTSPHEFFLPLKQTMYAVVASQVGTADLRVMTPDID